MYTYIIRVTEASPSEWRIDTDGERERGDRRATEETCDRYFSVTAPIERENRRASPSSRLRNAREGGGAAGWERRARGGKRVRPSLSFSLVTDTSHHVGGPRLSHPRVRAVPRARDSCETALLRVPRSTESGACFPHSRFRSQFLGNRNCSRETESSVYNCAKACHVAKK